MNRQPNHYSVNSRPQNEPMKSDTTGSVECLCSTRHSLPRSTVGGAATHIQLKRSGLKWAGHQSDWVIQIKLVKRRMLQRKEWFARNLIQSRPSECILTRRRGFVTSCCFIVEKNSHYNIIIPPPPCSPQMMAKPSESPVGRQHQSHPEETEEELREHQDGGSLPPGVTIKQEPPDPQELQEEAAMQQHRERQAEQELLFRQVEDSEKWDMCLNIRLKNNVGWENQ